MPQSAQSGRRATSPLPRGATVIETLIKILLAIFLPPIAAFMQVGASKHLWINIVLCILFWLPGQIHALWLVLTKQGG